MKRPLALVTVSLYATPFPELRYFLARQLDNKAETILLSHIQRGMLIELGLIRMNVILPFGENSITHS